VLKALHSAMALQLSASVCRSAFGNGEVSVSRPSESLLGSNSNPSNCAQALLARTPAGTQGASHTQQQEVAARASPG
jgi:hypothetical protein